MSPSPPQKKSGFCLWQKPLADDSTAVLLTAPVALPQSRILSKVAGLYHEYQLVNAPMKKVRLC